MIMKRCKIKYISPNLSENLFNDGLNFFNLSLSFILQQWENTLESSL